MKNSSLFALGQVAGFVFMVLGATPTAEAAQFAVKKGACAVKAWNGKAWSPADGTGLAGREIGQVTPPSKGQSRFKVGATWYQAPSDCITESRKPASVQAQSVAEVKRPPARAKGSGQMLRAALEYAGFSRTLGYDGKNYDVALKTVAFKAGYGARSFFKASPLYWGWNLDGFFGISSVAIDPAALLTYEGSGILTLGARGSGAIGYRLSNRMSAQFDSGAGFSFANLLAVDVAGVTSPSSIGLFPLFKLGGVYQIDPRMGLGLEVMSQGFGSDFAFAGGLQWML